MATKKVFRNPWTPTALKPEWISQTIRLAVRDNNRLKRAAKRRKMTFNAWAVQVLIEEANYILGPKVVSTPTLNPEGVTIGEASE